MNFPPVGYGGYIPPQDILPHVSSGPVADGYNGNIFPPKEFNLIKTVLIDGGDRFCSSAVAFDGQQELLWMGNQGGHVTSYFGADLHKYTSFQANNIIGEIRDILTIDNCVLALTADSLLGRVKYGQVLFKHGSPSLMNMQCMLQMSPTTVLLGGHQPIIVDFDIESRKEIRQVPVREEGCAILKHAGGLVASGDTSGKVSVRDPRNLSEEHILQAHSGTLSDFDVCGNQLITCGFSNRHGNWAIDRFLMTYDLRMMRAMSPIPMQIDPMFLRFMPTYSNRICVVSQIGQFQVLEQGILVPQEINNVPLPVGGFVTAFNVSSSYQAMAFGDSLGYLHLFANNPQAVFNHCSEQTEFAPTEPIHQSIGINDENVPLSVIPMPFPVQGPLLSDWPDELCQRMYRMPLGIDPEVMRNIQYNQNIGYAPNPANRRRNQVPYDLTTNTGPQKKDRKNKAAENSSASKDHEAVLNVGSKYKKVEVTYNKQGIEEIDYRMFNKTVFVALESLVPNAYCNALVQMLFFMEPLRCTLLSHLCEREFCLSCELGFLFSILDKQKGRAVQGSNFLRAFRSVPEAAALNLVLNDNLEPQPQVSFARLIQSWNRFILQQIHNDLIEADKNRGDSRVRLPGEFVVTSEPKISLAAPPKGNTADGKPANAEETKKDKESTANAEKSDEESTPSAANGAQDSIVRKLFGADNESHLVCRVCNLATVRNSSSFVLDLCYPSDNEKGGKEQYSFAEIVEGSLRQEQIIQSWCKKCDKYQQHVQIRLPKSLPDVLTLNCHLENSKDFEFWKKQEEFLGGPAPNQKQTVSQAKPCRYGSQCTRADCRFSHDAGPMTSGMGYMGEMREDPLQHCWLPIGLKVTLTNDGRTVVENISKEEAIPLQSKEDNVKYYELVGTVVNVKEEKGNGNIVSHMKVSEVYHQRKEKVTCTQWYLFNDLVIEPIEKEDAVTFNMDWKIPCILYYCRRQIHKVHPVEVKNPISPEVMFTNASLVTPRRKHITFMPLDKGELPQHGDVVALDTEFVTLNQEESEVHSDGTLSMIKPSQMSLARVTCIRGQGALMGEPFIDDYISTQEQVVDYLTQFSGIQPGDLDATISSKHLTTLKSTYLKLRYLVDSGVTFVGHGLKKDFQVMNLFVPQDQVTDTVDLFHQPRQRMLSLKFLAWYFLGMNIQSGSHDSIEDAKTALRLYYHYKEMGSKGMDTVRAEIKKLYDEARKINWKVPEGVTSPYVSSATVAS